jgi:hypothetical protein
MTIPIYDLRRRYQPPGGHFEKFEVVISERPLALILLNVQFF